ncbi:MAG: hypothetical protein CV087_05025 [Candidatus Brocadia sp. WS118]|nr:MAG: hypothetical protein CV087_05025 [Candidatus Brocadia sp. WS118]
MENRFMEMDQYLKRICGKKGRRGAVRSGHSAVELADTGEAVPGARNIVTQQSGYAFAQNPVAIAGLGVAVFNTGRTIATSGSFSTQSTPASYIHQNTPAGSKFRRRTIEFTITAHHPRYGIGTQTFWFKLSFEFNGNDIRDASINPLIDKSSSMISSTFSIKFEPTSYSLNSDPVAIIRYKISGEWDPVGTGHVSFEGNFDLKADGAVTYIINSEKNWVQNGQFHHDAISEPQSLAYSHSYPEEEFQQIINQSVTVPLNQNQKDALLRFVSDIGGERFRKSMLLRLLNQGSYDAVPAELKKWTKARRNGNLVDLPELVSKRKAEAELFQKPGTSAAQSLLFLSTAYSYRYESPSRVVAHQLDYSYAMNPLVIAGVTVSDAIQIGLGAIAVVQAQVSASQGSFTLSYDKVQRLLTSEARAAMPGSQSSKKSYSRRLLYLGIGAVNAAEADVIIEWEGNPYGEIGTPVIRRNLGTSTEWSKSSANITITKVDRIPLPNTDPRVWPIVYTYDGTYDPYGNGYFEFSGEFEINAFGGMKFNRHEVVSRSLADWAIGGTPEDKVQKGADNIVSVPPIPQDQINYLKTRLP